MRRAILFLFVSFIATAAFACPSHELPGSAGAAIQSAALASTTAQSSCQYTIDFHEAGGYDIASTCAPPQLLGGAGARYIIVMNIHVPHDISISSLEVEKLKRQLRQLHQDTIIAATGAGLTVIFTSATPIGVGHWAFALDRKILPGFVGDVFAYPVRGAQ